MYDIDCTFCLDEIIPPIFVFDKTKLINIYLKQKATYLSMIDLYTVICQDIE